MKTLIVDDHAVVREGLKKIISRINKFSEIFEAGSASEALEILSEHKCGVIFLDISLPDRNGLELLKDIKINNKECLVLMLSIHNNVQYALRALKAGADAYITKSEAAEELSKAVENVMNGKKYVSSDIAIDLTLSTLEDPFEHPHHQLSDREFEVFVFLAEGKSLKEIAEILTINSKTVSTYRTRILEKMGINSNSDITKYALRNNLIE